jgi:hypothetical protein
MKNYTYEEIQNLINEIKDNTEWLETTDGDEVASIDIENLEGILTQFLKTKIKLQQ